MFVRRPASWLKGIVVAVAAMSSLAVCVETAEAQHGARIRSHFGRIVHRHTRHSGPPVMGPEAAYPSEGYPGAGYPGAGYSPAGPAPGAGYGQAYYPGAAAAQTAYPYYTTKGPNDFFYGGQDQGGPRGY